jgi:transporter family-2 protein
MNKYLSAFTGALIAVMILFNGVLAKAFGNYSSSVIVHIVGLVTIFLVLIISGSKTKTQTGRIPLYLYSAGVIGVFTVVFTNIGFSALGVSATIALGLLG